MTRKLDGELGGDLRAGIGTYGRWLRLGVVVALGLSATASGCEDAAPDGAVEDTVEPGVDADAGSGGGVDAPADPPDEGGGEPDDGGPSGPDGGVEDVVEPADAGDTEGDVGMEPGEFGAPCVQNDDCLSGWCVDGPTGPVCTKLCSSECPEGFNCKTVIVAGDPVSMCVPVVKDLCTPCTDDLQCNEGACLSFDGEGRCAFTCLEDAECPGGFVCAAAPGGLGDPDEAYCQPATGSCECNLQTEAGERSCSVDNEHGACFGVQACAPETGWGACSAQTPEAETCNGLDDDCDFKVDDGLEGDGAACEETVEGVGTCAGVQTCAGPLGWVCSASTPAVEACDFLDNDCDGETDEDFRAEDGSWTLTGHCGTCGNDCTGLFANAAAACAAEGDGPPKCVVGSCDEGYYPSSAFTCVPIVSNLCLPCVDDAGCAVPGDQCLTLADGSKACGRACGPGSLHGEGCPDGYACEAAGVDGALQCVPVTGSCSCTAATAGLEKSCAVSGEFGTCFGAQVCSATEGWGPCTASTPAEEICNGVDDDCDGSIDEGVSPPEAACETTWEDAETGDSATCTGEWACVAGGAEGGAGVGWTCQAPQAGPEVCDYVDNDCDGVVDEDFKVVPVDAPAGAEATAYGALEHCGVCGYSCEGVLPNASAQCVVSSEGASCKVDTCDEGYYPLSDTTCAPVVDPSCAPCASDAACLVPGNQCLTLGGEDESFCGRDCSAGNLYGAPEGECPAGFSCLAFGDGQQCVPDTASCACYLPEHEGLSKSCLVTNALGTCTGVQECDASLGWTDCNAGTPKPELCNGLDDDCDGKLDESEELLPPLEACEVDNDFGLCSSTWVCGGEAGWQCDAATPTEESCDYTDEDCDGAVDEDFKDLDTGLYTAHAHCGLCQNSCEGAVLFAAETACEIVDGAAVCVAVSCQEGYFSPASTNQVCVPAAGGTQCSPCSDDSQCNVLPGGLCEVLDDATYCTRSCDGVADCPDEYACVTGRCRPVSGSCSCFADDAGAVRACFESNPSGTCSGTQACLGEGDEGGPGWTACSATTPKAEVCNGLDDDCDGLADEGVSPPDDPCAVENAFGVCAGAWICGPNEAAGATTWWCSAATPAEETCNYVDDDCDGVVDGPFRFGDDGPYVDDAHCGACGVSCTGKIPNAVGVCVLGDGTPSCQVSECAEGYYQAGPTTCLPVSDNLCEPCASEANCPTPGDTCVALDGASFCGRDCGAGNLHGLPDGECPDGYTCSDVGSGTPQCVPLSASCSCLPDDEGVERPCAATGEGGTCFGVETCDPEAGWVGCTAEPPSDEVCNGLDDDCNAIADDVPGRGEPCAIDNAFGSCPGLADCVVPGGEALVCVGPTPAAETCNDMDDDCDGDTDEAFPLKDSVCTAGEGACERPGVWVCAGDGLGVVCNAEPGPEGLETCNLVDDDCDGDTDEGFQTLGVYASDSACGNCFTDCLEIFDKPNAYGECDATGPTPVCELRCDPNAFDLNDVPDDGCEVVLDEDAIYVSESDSEASDSEACGTAPAGLAGSDQAPCASIGQGIARAQELGRSKVLVAGGAYVETVTVVDGVSLFGGYNPTTWSRNTATNLTALFGDTPSGHRVTLDASAVTTNITRVDGFVVYGQNATGVGENTYALYALGSNANLRIQDNVVYAGQAGPGSAGGDGGDGGSGGDGLPGLAAYEPAASFDCHGDCVGQGAENVGGAGGAALCGALDVSGGDGGTSDCPDYNESAPSSGGTASDCCEDTGTPGCSDPTIEACVCAIDSFCCSNTWDSLCATQAQNECGADCGGANGDLCATCSPDTDSQTVTTSGVTAPSGGGDGGLGGCDALMDFGCQGSCSCFFPPPGLCPQGGAGADGANGVDGSGGSAGAGCASPGGSLVDGHWAGAAGQSGIAGDAGRGGGGGGAAGGVEAKVSASCGSNGASDIGGSGGGGGGGGCGGSGGEGGLAGGGSFALFVVWDGLPTGGVPTISDNEIHGGLGGQGGDGGNGGVGGEGGQGAGGGASGPGGTSYWCAQAGGKGGEGGNGGAGGGGGGGCGGVAFGIFAGATGGVSTADWLDNTFATPPSGGSGGAGGKSGPGGFSGAAGGVGDASTTNL